MIRCQIWFKATIVAILAILMSACASTKLLDLEKTSDMLILSAHQRTVTRLKIEKIKELVEDYELEKETLKRELKERRGSMRDGGFGRGMNGGNRGNPGSKLRAFNEQRAVFQEQIDTLVAEFQEILDEKQREKFSGIELPKLKSPEFGSGRGFGGSRRRRGRGGTGFGGFGG